jgi:hypothetical protein
MQQISFRDRQTGIRFWRNITVLMYCSSKAELLQPFCPLRDNIDFAQPRIAICARYVLNRIKVMAN